MHVLILGARAPACLEWARAFSACGWQVTVADSLNWAFTRASRAVTHYARLPEPRSDPDAWIAALQALIHSQKIDVVLPTCEEVFYLAYGIEKLPCRVMAMPLPLLDHLHHKYRFACMTETWPAAAPESRLLTSASEVATMADETGEWVFKPAYSRFANRTLIRPAAAGLQHIHATPEQPWLAQRFIAGREHCSYSLLVDGRVTAHACYHPRYRVGKGSGIWFEPSDPAPILAFVERFGAATAYTGQVAFDFIESVDGRCHVIECNPRATSGIHLFDDQPQALVAALLGQTTDILKPIAAPRMVGFAMLLFAAPRHLFAGEFWRDFAAARDVIVRRGDWAPLFAQVPGLAEITLRALTRRRGLLAAATADIEWDGHPMGSAQCD